MTAARRGFTIFEMVLVVLIIALLMGILIPRLTGPRRIAFDRFVAQVGDLLTMYAHRDQTSSRPVGLWLDAQRELLHLVVLEAEADEALSGGEWRDDAFVEPVHLPETSIVQSIQFFYDGRPVDMRGFPLTHDTSRPRGWIEVIVEGAQGETAHLSLAPHALSPRVYGDRDSDVPEAAVIDLDRAGRSRQEW